MPAAKDAIVMLKDDHRKVLDLFKRFEKAGPRAVAMKRQLVDRISQELSVHAALEEQLFYPAVRGAVSATEDEVLESLEEHHIVKWTLSELEGMDPRDERFTPKVTVLIENVRHHIQEEEQDMFPKVRQAVTAASLKDLGRSMAEARRTMPTRPHPRAPDEPPGNTAAGGAASIIDKAKDVASGAVEKAVEKVKDLAS
jgi:iron-sulfur cluster repair protein YtfE (RIC family)